MEWFVIMFVRCRLAGLLLAVSPAVWADLPLTVEDLITDKGKVKLDL